MYVRFSLSLRNIDDFLLERGIDLCQETLCFWRNRFGLMWAGRIRRQREAASSVICAGNPARFARRSKGRCILRGAPSTAGAKCWTPTLPRPGTRHQHLFQDETAGAPRRSRGGHDRRAPVTMRSTNSLRQCREAGCRSRSEQPGRGQPPADPKKETGDDQVLTNEVVTKIQLGVRQAAQSLQS